MGFGCAGLMKKPRRLDKSQVPQIGQDCGFAGKKRNNPCGNGTSGEEIMNVLEERL